MFLGALALLGCNRDQPAPDSTRTAIECTTPQIVGRLPAELHEASGLAASLRTPGLWWTLNDDGPAELVAIDSTGSIRSRVRVNGASNDDWESLTSAPCDGTACLFIADIGDNLRTRREVSVYRIREPAPNQASADAERFDFRFPDMPHDAEAIFVLPGERLYLLTKGRSEALTLYRYPGTLRAGTSPVLELVQRFSESFVQLPDMITGAGATPDGAWIVIRTYSRLQLYRWQGDQLVPQLQPAAGIDLSGLREFQGEGVDLRSDGSMLMVSEKGLDEGAAPVSHVRCRITS
jgi:hypothetical protein